jgi:SAM-dependent methyltransferase
LKGLLPTTFFPPHDQNRMSREGDVARARADFQTSSTRNLRALLRQRLEWMNDHIKSDDIVVELGCGAGLTEFFVSGAHLFATDVRPWPWTAACVDALHLPFAPESVDVFLCVNMIHHLATPTTFLDSILTCLRPGGRLLIHEPNPSVMMLLALRLMRHEGWSFAVDAFDPMVPANDPSDPWSGNNAISQLLLGDYDRFQRRFPDFRFIFDRYSEFFLFPLSGGVTAKTSVPQLPAFVLRAAGAIDRLLCKLAPSIFAMGRSIALEKRLAA